MDAVEGLTRLISAENRASLWDESFIIANTNAESRCIVNVHRIYISIPYSRAIPYSKEPWLEQSGLMGGKRNLISEYGIPNSIIRSGGRSYEAGAR